MTLFLLILQGLGATSLSDYLSEGWRFDVLRVWIDLEGGAIGGMSLGVGIALATTRVYQKQPKRNLGEWPNHAVKTNGHGQFGV